MRILTFEQAVAEVLYHASFHRKSRTVILPERVLILNSLDRILADPILADRDQPPFNRATRDGFAVHAEEFSSGNALRIVGQIRAGEVWSGAALGSGEAIEIMTGAPVPAGADAVAMIEHIEAGGGMIQAAPSRTLRPCENIVPRGSEARAGQTVVPAGTPIGAAEIALAATSGQTTLVVHARSSVAIVATGDELVEPIETPDERQIRNSNSYALAALVAASGCSPKRLPIARDLHEDLLKRVDEGRQHDLLIFSGGVSMGKYDLVEEVLAECAAEFLFTGVRMQPGKPLVFGRLPQRKGPDGLQPERYFFGLPGNPVSTQVTFHCFVEPFLRVLSGEDAAAPKCVQATLFEDIAGKSGLTRVLPARLTHDFKRPSVRLVSWQGSGDLAANSRANCYAVLPPERDSFSAGDVITVLLR